MPVLNLRLQPGRFSVCQLPAGAPLPAWAVSAAGFQSISRTDAELSIVCREGVAPPEVKQATGWRMFEVAGPLDFSLTGIMASILDPLAKAGISIFAVSTYNTDYVLVQDAKAEAAVQALRDAGHDVKVP